MIRKLRRRWWASQARRRLGGVDEAMAARVRALIEELERKQARLRDEGRQLKRADFGYCASCGRPISPRRLRAVEGAVLCAACALIARRSRNLLEPMARRN